jgi:hypothetical protein
MSLRIKLPPKPNELSIHPNLPFVARNDPSQSTLTRTSITQIQDILTTFPEKLATLILSQKKPMNLSYTSQSRVKAPRQMPDRRGAKGKQYQTNRHHQRGSALFLSLDSDDEYAIDEDTPGAGMEDDGDLEADHKRQSKKARTKMPVKQMKGQGAEGTATEGRKTSPAKASTEPSEPRPITGSKRSRAKPLRPEDAGDAVSSPNISTRSPSPPRETSPPPATKKRKLPPIKKNKPAGATGPSTPSGTSAPNKAAVVAGAGLSKQGIPEVSKPAAVRKTPATAGNADFDLRNESVYRELFKTVGAKF